MSEADHAGYYIGQADDMGHQSGEDYCPPLKECKYCSAKDLVWMYMPEGWRLFTLGFVRHSCRRKKGSTFKPRDYKRDL